MSNVDDLCAVIKEFHLRNGMSELEATYATLNYLKAFVARLAATDKDVDHQITRRIETATKLQNPLKST